MAAAYAALVSVNNIIDQLQLHPRPPVSLDEKQAHSLTEKVSFLQAFLEDYSHHNSEEVDVLESQIAETVHAAEDVIESHIVDQILAGEKTSYIDFYNNLQKVIENMDFNKKEAIKIKEKIGVRDDQWRRSSSILAGSSRSFSRSQNRTEMVGFDDVLIELMDKLTNGEPARQIIPIVGMGGSEDSEIRRSNLIKLWIAEGFLIPIDGKSLEEAAEGYLKEFVDRNLILVHKYSSSGKIKSCRIHDLLRDLCLREAKKQRFLCVRDVRSFNTPEDLSTERRICIYESPSEKKYSPEMLAATLKSASFTRSLIWETAGKPLPSCSYRLLRVSSNDERSYQSFLRPSFQQVNLRYLRVHIYSVPLPEVSFFVNSLLCWNLQTFIVYHRGGSTLLAPSDIWKMPQLRHVEIKHLVLPDPPSGEGDDTVLENLQTLSRIVNFKFGEDVVKRIPNIKKLKIWFNNQRLSLHCYLNNLCHLHKLETLHCSFYQAHMQSDLRKSLTFPHSIKKLVLMETQFHWKDMTTKIGSLPYLEVLKLKWDACVGPHWETVDGQFCSLKFLRIQSCFHLKYWTTDSKHFPRLEHLQLEELPELKEIPWSIGDIPTLQSIQLLYCTKSAAESAEKIREEQEEMGNIGLKVQIGTTLEEEEEKGRMR